MKSENGITLVSVVITIILIMILAVIGTYNGLEVYENMRVENFVSKMKVVQEAVNKLCEQYSVQEINEMGTDIGNAPADDKEVLETLISDIQSLTAAGTHVNSWYPSAGDTIENNYRYFDEEAISSILGIKDFDTSIFFNPRSKNIVAVKGVKYDDKMYYRQYDLADGQTLPAPNTDTDFSLSLSVKTFDNKAIILVNTDKNIKELKYCKKNPSGNYDDSTEVLSRNLNEIEIFESGTYRVKAKTTTGRPNIAPGNPNNEEGWIEKTAEVEVVIVNKPLLVPGMTPVKYNGGASIDTTIDDRDWYNYGERRWANVKLKDGSEYVWIPRYAYSIEYTDSNHISAGGSINIEFMKDDSDLITTSGNTLKNNYKVMPAFRDGSINGYANGEWDSEITGIWIAKYETTAQNVNSKNYPKNVNVQDQAWRNIYPKDAFNICREMEALDTDTYFDDTVIKASGIYKAGKYSNDNNNIDTHLMKNSEWGAVAYLTYSNYGNTNLNSPNSNYISEGISNNYSSTENSYGVYGLSGGFLEMVAAGKTLRYLGFDKDNESTKYATYYADSAHNNIYGDALKETDGWNSCIQSYPTELIARGGAHQNFSGVTGESGLFAYQNKDSSETIISFRPAIIVEYGNKNEIKGNAAEIASNPENIGKIVNYGVSYADVVDPSQTTYMDWEILYADKKNVYIITKFGLAQRDLTVAVANNSTYHGTTDFENLDITKYPAVADNWAYKIFFNGNLLYNSNRINMRCAEYLLDSTNEKWKNLKNNKAKWVIGGPTLELLVASYNLVNSNNKVEIADLPPDKSGYSQTLGRNSLPISEIKSGNEVDNNYRPWNHMYNYWLATPATDADNHEDKVECVVQGSACVSMQYYDYITNNRNDTEVRFRPVVCLNSNIVLTWNSTTHKFDLSER